MTRSLHIKNARIWDAGESVQRDLFTKNGRIVDSAAHDALELDLEGYTIFPGLINAHDHLELNHYPRTKFRDVYNNAHEWGEDVNARLNDEPFKTLRAYPLWDKVFIGGLKNLLCGATTVIHHGPPHQPMFRKDFPVRVLQKYGWSHSLHFNTEDEIVRSYRSTPKDVPWFIHLAEGTDDIAAGEYQRLKKLGCVGSNTVIVHGVGMTDEDIEDAARTIKGLVWCSTTNDYLLGQTIDFARLTQTRLKIFIGTDSRLTTPLGLLHEMRFNFIPLLQSGPDLLIQLHKNDCIYLDQPYFGTNLGLVPSTGILNPGFHADFCIYKPGGYRKVADELKLAQSELGLIARDGIPRIGSPELMAKFPHIETVGVILDGIEKRIHIDLARQIHRCQLKEPGLEIDALPKNRFWLF